jgi:hypothetical protein
MKATPRSIMLTWANTIAGWWTSAAVSAIQCQQRAMLGQRHEAEAQKASSQAVGCDTSTALDPGEQGSAEARSARSNRKRAGAGATLHVVSCREAASSMDHVNVALLELKPFRRCIADPQPNLDVALVTVLLPQSIGHLFGDARRVLTVLTDDPGDHDPHFPIHRENLVGIA